MNKTPIRIGILGYGNLGRGVELALGQTPDLVPAAIFTRRDPSAVRPVTPGLPVYPAEQLLARKEEIDVLILCGGSATDLPEQSPRLSEHFNIVDSFDTHAKIPEHFARCDESAKRGGKAALLSAGWDPGLFSLQRLLGECVLPQGHTYTFWGKGVSQGHSDAIRRIPGVLDARQYTVPVESAMEQVRRGEAPELTARQKHLRQCFVVAAPEADKAAIEQAIKTMPHYFDEYDTTVCFLSQEELDRDHKGLPHGGTVLRSGVTGAAGETDQLIEFSLKLGSNPQFTSSVLVACARALWRLRQDGKTGALTLLDVPPAYLSPKPGDQLRKELL